MNIPTTPASVASRLTDEEIERLAKINDEDYEWHKRNHVPTLAKNYKNVAAVLRDYVRLRKLANAVDAKVDAVNGMPSAPLDGGTENQKINGEKLCAKITAFAKITRLLADTEKGDTK